MNINKTHLSWAAGAVIIIIGLALRLPRLGNYDNLYYTAGVQSMTQNWGNFIYGSFDPVGLVTLDKPPLAFWVQAIPGILFGVDAWAVAIPQLIIGIIAIPVLFTILKSGFGLIAASFGALTLSVLPASVIIDTRNEPDALVVFALLLAAVSIIKATQTSNWKWIIAFSIFMAMGFNAKMLVAFIPLPIFLSYFMLASKEKWAKTAIKASTLMILTIAISFSWICLVAFTPENRRPHVGSTMNNSIWTLTFEYNGLRRFDGFSASPSPQYGNNPDTQIIEGYPSVTNNEPQRQPLNRANINRQFRNNPPRNATGFPPTAIDPCSPPPSGPEIYGTSSLNVPKARPCPPPIEGGNREQNNYNLLGLFKPPLGEQLGWLLPLVLFLSLLSIASTLKMERRDINSIQFINSLRSNKASQTFLWVGWLFISLLIFGSANATHTHPYYLVGVAIPLSATVGIGLSTAKQKISRSNRWKWSILPAIVLCSYYQCFIARDSIPQSLLFIGVVVTSLGFVSVISGLFYSRFSNLAILCGFFLVMISLTFIPAYHATKFGNRIVAFKPPVRPNNITFQVNQMRGAPINAPNFAQDTISKHLLELSPFKKDQIIVATMRARDAAPLIIDGIKAVAIGGFSGNDSILSLDEFKEMSGDGNVLYFVNTNADGPRRPIRNVNKPQNQVIADYVRGHWVDYSQRLGLPENTFFKNPYSH